MKLIRFYYKRNISWGIVENGVINILRESPFNSIQLMNEKISLKKVKSLPPAEASKIILVGLNYKDHIRELNLTIPKEPVIFLKPPTSLIGNEDEIIYPKGVKRLDYEAELAIIIKKEGKNIPSNKVSQYILGYTCLNDITARDIQQKDGQWIRSKGFDTFCPLGPVIETELNPGNLNIKLYLNGELKQNSSTLNLIFTIPALISFISRVMTILPGDIISTGTPPGIGSMEKGDTVEVEIENIGRLINYVV